MFLHRITRSLLDGTKICPEEKEKWWLDRACRSSTHSSFLLDPVNDDNKMVSSSFLIFGLLALQRIGRHQVAYSESPGTQRVVSHGWSTAWDPSESNLSLLRLSHLACPAAAYSFNLVP